MGRAVGDSPAAMMVNGKILCTVSPYAQNGGSPGPAWFYEYDPTDYTQGPNGSFVPTSSPGNPTNGSSFNDSASNFQLLDLPDGTVLANAQNAPLYVYIPDGLSLVAGKPVIKSITANADGSYHLTGTGLNGISEGAAYGDDAQMDSNYPLVRMTDSAGNVYYGRTYNWSSTSVMTGSRAITTEFRLPSGLPPGSYSMVAVANGVSSDPVPFPAVVGAVWVAFGGADPGIGTYDRPFNTLAGATNAVSAGGSILIKGPSSTPETIRISKPMSIYAVNGASTIGR
jgi:hypothetical protein